MMNKYIRKGIFAAFVGGALMSCQDFLEKEPPSYLTPEGYYTSDDQVQAVVNKLYTDILPSHNGFYGIFQWDQNTDNQASIGADGKYAEGQWKVGMDNGEWSWGSIRKTNYQIAAVEDGISKGRIGGSQKNINQYLGELYFLRAYKYFDLLQKWGDLPIITEALPDNEAILVEANKRSPRNEVARFILKDLDRAIELMSDNFDPNRNRVTKDAVVLVKSRVALFEGSWLTYFKGTPFVPNGPDWPGKTKEYNTNYQFPAGNIEEEAKFFLETAASAAEIIVEKYKGKLVQNTGLVPQSESDAENPYFSLFGNTDMTGYVEVLLWRKYDKGLGITNNIEVAVEWGNGGVGVTRSMVEGFLMKDGKPIYASTYAYNDETLSEVRTNRDPRLTIFLKEPSQINYFKNMNDQTGDTGQEIEPYPALTDKSTERAYTTGYTLRKGGTFDRSLTRNWAGYTAAICFRATEALLNYMEAQYMLTGNLNSGKILEYWKLVREKAGFQGEALNPQVTIAATDITREKQDWGAYSGGSLLTDAVLYNIRRERRCELMAEGLRWMDLIRWRSLDQMTTERYHVEGFRLWNTPMTSWYSFKPEDYNGSSSAKVSSPELSEYLRPYESNQTGNNLYKDGYIWHLAHYLQLIPINQFLLTSSDYSSVELSPLYQNPYWPTVSGEAADK